jgi:hypothetical protein
MFTQYFLKRIILILVFASIIQSGFSQQNYLPGYIVPLKGDTLKGFIDYRNWEGTPDKVAFKKELSADKVIFRALDIKGFSVVDEWYESAIIQTDISSGEIEKLSFDSRPELITDTTFLQSIVKGKKSLFFYRNMMGKDQFYIKNDSSYELLIYKKYKKEIDDRIAVNENKKFRGQLSFYMSDYPKIQARLSSINYAKDDLEKLFDEYYKATQSEFEFHKKKDRTNVEAGLLTGLSLTSLKFSGDAYFYFVKKDFKQSLNVPIGLFADVILRRNRRKWSIYNELIFTSYKAASTFTDYESANNYTIYNTMLKFSWLKMNNMIRFKFPINKAFIFFNAGVSNGYIISETNHVRRVNTFYSTVRPSEGKALYTTHKYEPGYNFGMGTRFRNYSIEFRFENANGVSLNSSTRRYYFIVGYRFKS